MYSALAGTFIILSIGILMAHAMDAFRSGGEIRLGLRREWRGGCARNANRRGNSFPPHLRQIEKPFRQVTTFFPFMQAAACLASSALTVPTTSL